MFDRGCCSRPRVCFWASPCAQHAGVDGAKGEMKGWWMEGDGGAAQRTEGGRGMETSSSPPPPPPGGAARCPAPEGRCGSARGPAGSALLSGSVWEGCASFTRGALGAAGPQGRRDGPARGCTGGSRLRGDSGGVCPSPLWASWLPRLRLRLRTRGFGPLALLRPLLCGGWPAPKPRPCEENPPSLQSLACSGGATGPPALQGSVPDKSFQLFRFQFF